MAADDTVRAALRAAWHLPPDGCTRLAGGMTSATWSVRSGSRRYVAKLVPPEARTSFEAGLMLAERLCAAGVDAGRPVRAADGSLCVPVPDGALALLEHIDGRPLDGADPVDQRWWGDRLGSVHRILVDVSLPGLTPWHWVREDAPHLSLEPWLRPAVADAVHALARLQVTDRLTVGALHGDPFFEAFLLDRATGRIGVIDWGSACCGPFLYDVASAVMYAGGPDRAAGFLEAYAAAGPVTAAELESALPVLLRFRWAVQADWFAARIAAGDVTGADDDGNRKGLADARRALAGWS
ncbi:homoserine kinase type II [Hamadaea flava]|uniref:Phosphotransferase enzyme family protein n=1 Tax=Hamadaea flava TaxID=1742688 RepID=A0ABV8LUR6_9ACTN|nr:phosphotransferase [Hamadaea flava]MCP2327886.1 homoserine kinase type II [Hamadaea flava]